MLKANFTLNLNKREFSLGESHLSLSLQVSISKRELHSDVRTNPLIEKTSSYYSPNSLLRISCGALTTRPFSVQTDPWRSQGRHTVPLKLELTWWGYGTLPTWLIRKVLSNGPWPWPLMGAVGFTASAVKMAYVWNVSYAGQRSQESRQANKFCNIIPQKPYSAKFSFPGRPMTAHHRLNSSLLQRHFNPTRTCPRDRASIK